MAQKDARTIQAELARPFAPEDLEWRLQQTEENGKWGLAVPFVTNRAIQARLDEVLGVDGWYNDYRPWHGTGKKEAQICGISIRFPEQGFITKWDGAEDSDIEPVKGGLSDSMKRAAVQWGIGRCLYGMDAIFVDVEKRGRSWIIKKTERTKLDKAYLDYLAKLKLEPTPAGGVQSTLTPKQTGEAPAAGSTQTGLAPVQPLPKSQPGPDNKTGTYTVIATRPQKFANGIHTTVMLQGWDQKQIAAVAMGERPELVKGVQLTGVKLELQRQDTVVFYILRDYRIVVSQDQAA